MFKLFKIRTFGDYISDTFQFIKVYGKHYFKNYFKFAFIALLILMVAIAMIATFYSRIFATSMGGFGDVETFDNNFVSENAVMLIIGFIAIIITILYLSLLNYSYPVYYLKLLGENTASKPDLSQIKLQFKKDLGRLILFGFISIIVFGAVGLVTVGIATILTFLLIGLLLLPIIIPFLTTWYTLTLYYYLNENEGFFGALHSSFQTITKNFWAIIGANLCVLLIVYIINTAITLIPYIFVLIGFISGMQNPESLENFESSSLSLYMTLMMVVYCVALISGLILNHLTLIQVGLVYYSDREDTEQFTLRQSIEEIGAND